MKGKESILGSAKTHIDAKRTVDEATIFVTEHLFETKVKPLLEQISTDFLERSLPPIYLPLIEEIKKFIEQKEGAVLKSKQAIFYFDTEPRTSYSLRAAFQAYTLTDTNLTINNALAAGNIMDSWRREERKKWVDLFESNALLERLGVGVHTRLSSSDTFSGLRDGWYITNAAVNVRLTCFNNNNDFVYRNRLTARLGSDSWSVSTNSEEEINEFLEKMVRGLDSRKYLGD